MPWGDIAFTLPATADAINTALAGVGALSDTELTAANGRVVAIEPSAAFTLSPVAAAAANAIAARADFVALLNALPNALAVHPFVGGVGQDEGFTPYLSAPDALGRMAAKLIDTPDLPNTATAGLFILLRASNTSGLAAVLAAFNAVLGTDALRWAQKRALALVDHANTRLAEVAPPLSPYWRTVAVQDSDGAARTAGALAGTLAQADGYDAENTTPTDELQLLITKKQQQNIATEQAYTDLAALFQGGAGQAVYLEASDSSALRAALLAEPGPGAEWVQCAGVAWVGSPAELLFLKEAVGL